MTFVCKCPNDGYENQDEPKVVHPCEVKLFHGRNMYDDVRYCKVCTVFLSITKNRCPCCNAPLRRKSKRTTKLLGTKSSTRKRTVSNFINNGACC